MLPSSWHIQCSFSSNDVNDWNDCQCETGLKQMHFMNFLSDDVLIEMVGIIQLK